MLLKHILPGRKMVVKYEPRRPPIFAAGRIPNPGTATLSRLDPGSTCRIVRATPHLYRFRRAWGKKCCHPELAPDRQVVARPADRFLLRQAKNRMISSFRAEPDARHRRS